MQHLSIKVSVANDTIIMLWTIIGGPGYDCEC